MRAELLLFCLLLSACATDKLALAPPASVDFSGRWTLNEAESDDPQRLLQSQAAAAADGRAAGSGGQGGGRNRQGGRGGPGGGPGIAGPVGPTMPGAGALAEGLRWPVKDLEVKQIAGVVTFSSGGQNQIYEPSSNDKKPRHLHPPAVRDLHARDRNMPSRGRGDGPPALCGWEDKTLVIESGDADEDHPPFVQRYSLSEDGERLVEIVGFQGGRSNGFTMSRVWDRVLPSAK